MQSQIDPISQMLGGLSAQVSALAAQIIDLRSEIVTNRQVNQSRWDDMTKQLDEVKAEYRNVKHAERGAEQKEVALSAWMKGVESRLGKIENVILIWRIRVSTLLAVAVAGGTMLGFLVKVGAEALAKYFMG